MADSSSTTARPHRLAPSSRSQCVLAAVWIGLALTLASVLSVRLLRHEDLPWWVPLAVLAGILTADFASGVLHWAADTWGRSDLPFLGPRFLVPFRVHHLNPDDFLTRGVLDTNGDAAALTVPVLVVLCTMPLNSEWALGTVAFGCALCIAAGVTNQIHQWAHMDSPPAPVRAGQQLGFLLPQGSHARHHDMPYEGHYCITTGWCNRPLEAIGFFRRCETAVTWLTGARPRVDEHLYAQRVRSLGPTGDV